MAAAAQRAPTINPAVMPQLTQKLAIKPIRRNAKKGPITFCLAGGAYFFAIVVCITPLVPAPPIPIELTSAVTAVRALVPPVKMIESFWVFSLWQCGQENDTSISDWVVFSESITLRRLVVISAAPMGSLLFIGSERWVRSMMPLWH